MTDPIRRYHAFQSQIKATEGTDGLGAGEFWATAAVFDNIDSYGEVIRGGAFMDTLAEKAASGDPFPVIFQHNWADPFANIGTVLEIKENAGALLYKGKVDLDNPFAAQVYRLMKGRRIVQQSFGFDIIEAGWATVDGQEVYEITKVKLYEVGPCLVGVNQSTKLLGIKSSDGTDIRAVPTPPSGQEEEPAADDTPLDSVPEVVPDSAPEPSASKGLSPASVRLVSQAEIEFLEGI
jgi:HK97 family phage prohead protease